MSDEKFFGIDPGGRATIPEAKRAAGFGATQEPHEYMNQAILEQKADIIIGTITQLANDQCTVKYQSSDQTLRDSAGSVVTPTDGNKIWIVGLDTLSDDFDLSAYDRLRVQSDKSITLDNSGFDLIFGDETYLDLKVSSTSNIVKGSDNYGFVNYQFIGSSLKQYLGDGTDFTITGQAGFNITGTSIIPFKTVDGSWFIMGYISYSQTPLVTASITIPGVTSKTGPIQTANPQNLSGADIPLDNCSISSATNVIAITFAATVADVSVTFLIALDSKPTWAD
jgi:hypothetical protein